MEYFGLLTGGTYHKMVNKNALRILLIKFTAVIFIIAVLMMVWSWFSENLSTITWVSGGLLVIYMLFFPEFKTKKFFRGFKRRIR